MKNLLMLSKKASVPQGRSGGHWSRAESSPSWERRAAGFPLSARFEVSAADSRACRREQPMSAAVHKSFWEDFIFTLPMLLPSSQDGVENTRGHYSKNSDTLKWYYRESGIFGSH